MYIKKINDFIFHFIKELFFCLIGVDSSASTIFLSGELGCLFFFYTILSPFWQQQKYYFNITPFPYDKFYISTQRSNNLYPTRNPSPTYIYKHY